MVIANRKIDPLRGLIPFTILVTGVSLILFFYLYLGREPRTEIHGFRSELAEVFGTAGLWTLAAIYGRSMLKLLLAEGTMLQRFIPEVHYNFSLSVSQKFLNFLNRTHKYVGATSVVLLACHAILSNTTHWNLFLEGVLILLVWQGGFGLFLVVRFPMGDLKRYSYLVHAQLFTGVMIGIFASFGHLLV